MPNTQMAVMEVLVILGIFMGPAGLLVQAGNVNQLVRLRAYYNGRSTQDDTSQYHLDPCSSEPYYHDLLQLIDVQSCLPAVKTWDKLFHLTPDCRRNILWRLSDYFGYILDNPSYCVCDQDFQLPRYTMHAEVNCNIRWSGCYHDHEQHDKCMHHNNEYRDLYNTYVANGHHGYGVCRTHHQVWQHLNNVYHSGEYHYCLENIVKHLFYAYQDQSGCQCTMATVVHDKTTTTPLASILALPSCKKYETITSLAYGMQFHHPIASNCGTTNNHGGSEALVLNLCQTTNDTLQWKEGPNVMSNCRNIPLYTPIATFINGAYSSNGGLSGIFIGCLPDGFKIAVQECGSNSTILHLIHGGILTHDPKLYFVVTQ